MEENVGGFSCINWAATAAPSSSSASSFPHQQVVASTISGPHFPHPQAPHQHLTCLKLGKRQYYGAADNQQLHHHQETGAVFGAKRERSAASAARCQVEGCNSDLTGAKEYHRRHKVCQMHSKTPKVTVLGVEQRFCQQCSRFHVVSEFDDSKRSCRRRLAGHNERRRKSSAGGGGNDSILRHSTAFERTLMGSRFPYLSETAPGRALSLLSFKACPWISPELSYRSSAALHELIAENRASLLARQILSTRDWHSAESMSQSLISFASGQNQSHEPVQGTSQPLHGWNQFQEPGSHLTLDLMQSANSSSFEFISERNKSKEAEEECCEIWKSLTHVV